MHGDAEDGRGDLDKLRGDQLVKVEVEKAGSEEEAEDEDAIEQAEEERGAHATSPDFRGGGGRPASGNSTALSTAAFCES
jgi:hypothetical protein